MPERTRPPFRADHVGSLIRPDALIKARERADKGEMPAAELTRNPARRHPRRGAAAGGDRPQGRDRRRVQPPLLAPRLHAEVRQCQPRPVQDEGALPHRRGRPREQRAGAQGHRQDRPARQRRHLRRRLQVPGVGRARDAEDHHPVADRDAFPRRPRGDRRAAYPDIADFYDDLARLYREEIADFAPRRLPLSADRRGQSRLSVRSGAAPPGRQYRRGRRRRCRRPTPSCSTTRSGTSPPT